MDLFDLPWLADIRRLVRLVLSSIYLIEILYVSKRAWDVQYENEREYCYWAVPLCDDLLYLRQQGCMALEKALDVYVFRL